MIPFHKILKLNFQKQLSCSRNIYTEVEENYLLESYLANFLIPSKNNNFVEHV